VCLARVLERHVAAFAAHGWGRPALAPGPALLPELTPPARSPSSNTHVAATAPGEYHAVVAAGACKALKEASPCVGRQLHLLTRPRLSSPLVLRNHRLSNPRSRCARRRHPGVDATAS
jgi:hypothetical protein